jgi:hypothetical protein
MLSVTGQYGNLTINVIEDLLNIAITKCYGI